MSKLVKFEIETKGKETIPCYVNPELVTSICANLVNGGTIIYFDDNNLINVIGDVGEIAAKLNGDIEEIKTSTPNNTSDVDYKGKRYHLVAGGQCCNCALKSRESNTACFRCGLDSHYEEILTHE